MAAAKAIGENEPTDATGGPENGEFDVVLPRKFT
jgi:hypothetical protein